MEQTINGLSSLVKLGPAPQTREVREYCALQSVEHPVYKDAKLVRAISKVFKGFRVNDARDNKSRNSLSDLYIALERYGERRKFDPEPGAFGRAVKIAFSVFGGGNLAVADIS